MKLTLTSGILAASFAMTPTHADTPLIDAFSDLLGSCWAYSAEGRIDEIYSADELAPVYEMYCFERMENHFVRIRRQAPGPHGGAFFNEEILQWNAAYDTIITVMFTNLLSWGHINYRDGIVQDGRVILDISDDESSSSQARLIWGAVQGDQFSLTIERDMGENYGGWVAAPARIYTRQDASVGPALDALMTGGATFTPATELFQPLLGACWSTEINDSGATDTHCFTDLMGRYVRDRHIVPGNPAYSGETLFFADRESDSIEFYYYNSIGGISEGYDVHAANGIAYDHENYRGPNGEDQTFRGRYEDISYRGYISITEELQGEDWVEVSRQTFTRTEHNPFETID